MAKRKLNRMILALCACLLAASVCMLSACSTTGNYIVKFIRAIDSTIAYSKSYAIYASEDLCYANASYVRTDTVSMAAAYSHKSGEIAYLYEDSDEYVDPTGDHESITFTEVSEYYKLKDASGSFAAYYYDGKDRVCTAKDETYLTMMDGAHKLTYIWPVTDTSNLYLPIDLLYYMLVHNGGPGIGHGLNEYTLEAGKSGGTAVYTASYSGTDETTGVSDDVSVTYFISGRRISGYTVKEDSSWTEDGVECSLAYSLSYEFSYAYDSGIAAGADLGEYESMD
ncbi:MAG: hypothetical protein LUD51_00855 [Clostridia bacterium]|nr:hypothetical protein [Clostridia bacterium]